MSYSYFVESYLRAKVKFKRGIRKEHKKRIEIRKHLYKSIPKSFDQFTRL